MFSIPTNRNRMMNTFIIINITLHVWDSLKDKSMLFHSKKAFLFPSVWRKIEYTWALFWKKILLIYFEIYQGISIPTQAE